MRLFLRRGFSGWLPRCALLLLVPVAGICAAYWSWAVWVAWPGRAMNPAAVPSKLMTQQGSENIDVSAITSTHLFGRNGAISPVQQGAMGQRLKLVGTFSGWRSFPEYALVSLDGGRPQPFAKGTEVMPGVSIREIAPEYIVVKNAGLPERLNMSPKSALPELGGSNPVPAGTSVAGKTK